MLCRANLIDFLDASALVAIIAREQDAASLAERLQRDAHRIHSAISSWETVAALCRSYEQDVPSARTTVRDFLETVESRLVPIGAREAELATMAYQLYGRGRHRAALNMGDCFAYACAEIAGARILYKGTDFALTDLA